MFRKKICGHLILIHKKEREVLEFYSKILEADKCKKNLKPRRERTDFYTNSTRMDKECQKDGEYWASKTKMTARVFAYYIKDRLSYVSDYLYGYVDSAYTYWHREEWEI